MGAATLISVEEYLHTNYDPDREYVDGEVVERNLGEKTHSTIQGNLIYHFRLSRDEWGVRAYPEQRGQISPTHFRIPDVTVIKAIPGAGRDFHQPAAPLHRDPF